MAACVADVKKYTRWEMGSLRAGFPFFARSACKASADRNDRGLCVCCSVQHVVTKECN